MNFTRIASSDNLQAPNATAIVLSPVLAKWDKGAFCDQLSVVLNRMGYEVIAIDTLSVCDSRNAEEALMKLESTIKSFMGRRVLLVGFALGGTCIQCLANRFDGVEGILSISGPGYPAPRLRRRIGSVMFQVAHGNLVGAMAILYRWLAPVGASPNAPPEITESDRELAISRLLVGFGLLLNLDARSSLASYRGRFLSLLGDSSQLAERDNQALASVAEQQLALVPNAGMRPWEDNPDQSSTLVIDWLTR